MFKVSPPLTGGSQKGHNTKCAKLLTSTVLGEICPRSDPDIAHMEYYLDPL